MFLPHWASSLECYLFYYTRAYTANGSFANADVTLLDLRLRESGKLSTKDLSPPIMLLSSAHLICLCPKVAYIAHNMDKDQIASKRAT